MWLRAHTVDDMLVDIARQVDGVLGLSAMYAVDQPMMYNGASCLGCREYVPRHLQ